MDELGPFHAMDFGGTIYENVYAWNKVNSYNTNRIFFAKIRDIAHQEHSFHSPLQETLYLPIDFSNFLVWECNFPRIASWSLPW